MSSFALRKFRIGLQGPNVSLREPSYVTYTILVGPPPFDPRGYSVSLGRPVLLQEGLLTVYVLSGPSLRPREQSVDVGGPVPLSRLRICWMDCAEIWCVARGPLTMHFTHDGGYLHEHTGNCHIFKHIYLLPLVHRQKGVLLVLEFLHTYKKILTSPCRRSRARAVTCCAFLKHTIRCTMKR